MNEEGHSIRGRHEIPKSEGYYRVRRTWKAAHAYTKREQAKSDYHSLLEDEMPYVEDWNESVYLAERMCTLRHTWKSTLKRVTPALSFPFTYPKVRCQAMSAEQASGRRSSSLPDRAT